MIAALALLVLFAPLLIAGALSICSTAVWFVATIWIELVFRPIAGMLGKKLPSWTEQHFND